MDDRIEYVMRNTEVLRLPTQRLATFGSTNIRYYLVTDLLDRLHAVREGRVIAEMPRVITPTYVPSFEGFGEYAQELAEWLLRNHGPEAPLLRYRYRNEPKDMSIVSESLEAVVGKLNRRIDEEKDSLCGIVKGVEDMWDISVWKLAFEMSQRSLSTTVSELGRQGFLEVDQGIPRQARFVIERLFEEVERDRSKAQELVDELNRWGLFPQYEDRFLSLFRKGQRWF